MNPEALDITAVVQQRLAWDIVPCDEIDEMWGALDLIAPSPDVAEVAHEESHRRLEKVEPLSYISEVYVILAADIVSKVMAKHYTDAHGDILSDAEMQIMRVQNQEVVKGCVFPILAHLLDTKMIQLGPTAYANAKMRLI